MPWLQLRIDTDSNSAPHIEDSLLAVGAVSVTLQDNADQPILEPDLGQTPLWDATRITGLFDASVSTSETIQRLRGRCPSLPDSFSWEQLEDKDWEREWMKNYHPIDCGNGFWICPSWREPPDTSATNMMLDPGLAFGTGTHPTTFLCLQWLAELAATEKLALSQSYVLDYGCGSGILAIAALLLGAGQATGVDIDPQALLASRDNAQRNGLKDTLFPVFLPPQFKPMQADITFANILAGPLAELAPVLIENTRPGGWLCLSGILEEQANSVIAAYQSAFDFEPIRKKEEWVCLTARKH